MAPLAVFRADATPEMGGGHVQRCLALSAALTATGWRTMFTTRPDTLHTVPALAASAYELLMPEMDEAKEATDLTRRFRSGCDLLVVDHYQRGAVFERGCRRFASRILSLEDRPGRRHDCDVLLDPTPSRGKADYAPLVPPRCKLLLGPAFAVLRPEFVKQRPAALALHAQRRKPERLFVSIGLTDPQNLTAAVLVGISQSGVRLSVDIALGSAAPHLNALREQIEALQLNARLHIDAANVAGLMAAADLAVGAAGSSSFERCCLGLPSLVVVVADNQQDIAKVLLECGAAAELDRDDLAQSVARQLHRLCADTQRLFSMSEAAATLCDGRGGERVAAELAVPLKVQTETI